MCLSRKKQGLLLINTGDGKGKTTAALGLLLRAWGWDMRVAMFQFIKSTRLAAGEHRAARKLGLDIRALGSGFTWKTGDVANAEAMALEQWSRCREAVSSGQFDMLILDEISYPINSGWIPITQVLETIQIRPLGMHLLLTGRRMPEQLIEIADLVTDMREVKHPYRCGIKAQKGIEY